MCEYGHVVTGFHTSIVIYWECEIAPASGGGLGPGMQLPGCETIDMHEAGHVVDAEVMQQVVGRRLLPVWEPDPRFLQAAFLLPPQTTLTATGVEYR